ncbi:hypothetical protein NM688_g1288 [Phlebia brevispora]|uniref:Uncharacterized protein n=1 Tax=Phlebia brevispora TaxID=194682 RepID=A0ACC1TBY5_9APHY|nr:hypothetical protein NM688_g1288 [Phlebia brevispora]
MPRENSFSDSDGRSLTPDLEDEFDLDTSSPVQTSPPVLQPIQTDIPHQHGFTRPSMEAKEGTYSCPTQHPCTCAISDQEPAECHFRAWTPSTDGARR